jgi:hypothetical protein
MQQERWPVRRCWEPGPRSRASRRLARQRLGFMARRYGRAPRGSSDREVMVAEDPGVLKTSKGSIGSKPLAARRSISASRRDAIALEGNRAFEDR